MSRFVREIMNAELLSFRPHHPAGDALADLVHLGITGAPVLDDEGRPIGLVSLRDLSVVDGQRPVRLCMSQPVVVVQPEAGISEVAELMGRTGLHRVVVVNAAGEAVGMVSNLDVIRALMAQPVRHPASFPHFDAATSLVWSDPADLTLDAILALAPDLPGIFALLHDPPGARSVVVWAEASANVSSRLLDLVSTQQPSGLDHVLAFRNLQFRVAVVPDAGRRAVALQWLLNNGRHQPAAAHATPVDEWREEEGAKHFGR